MKESKLSQFLKSFEPQLKDDLVPEKEEKDDDTLTDEMDPTDSPLNSQHLHIDTSLLLRFQSTQLRSLHVSSPSLEDTPFIQDPSYIPTIDEIDAYILSISKHHLLSISYLFELVQNTIQVIKSEPNLLTINGPVLIIGDLHGQYYDLLQIFQHYGYPGYSYYKYLFLGDYIDRGSYSCEILSILYYLKYYFPSYIYLLRGNHETRRISNLYGFQNECEKKYGNLIYNSFIQSFQYIPIACIIQIQHGRILALHAGISPFFQSLEQLDEINRMTEPEMDQNSILRDILWSDPKRQLLESNQQEMKHWTYNYIRGCSYFYSMDYLEKFLRENDLLCLVRGHEMVENGYVEDYSMHETTFPSLVTVFSAPEYCNKFSNKGAVLEVEWESKSFHYKIFLHREEPLHMVLQR